ncbi:acetolactate synthase large subunit [Vallitalea sediminicola]
MKIIDYLIDKKVNIHSVPGSHNLPLYEVGEKESDLKLLSWRTEYGAFNGALGSAKAMGKTEIITTIAGPGITSLTTVVGQAYAESVPLICIGVNNYKKDMDAEKGLIHEIADSRGLFEPITAVSVRAETGKELANMIYHFMENSKEIAKPIYIEVPSEIFSEAFENNAEITKECNILEEFLYENDDEIEKIVDECAKKLINATLPVIHIGWGGQLSDVSKELIEICNTCGVMVIPTVRARGLLEENYPYNAGAIWDRGRQVTEIAQKSDLVIAIGTRLSMLNTKNGTLPIEGDLYHIVNDSKFFGVFYPDSTNLKCDSKRFLKMLLEKIKGQKNEERCNRIKETVARIREQWDSKLEEKVPAVSKLMSDIREAYDEDTHFVVDMCQEGYWLARYIHMNRRLVHQSPFYFGTLGASIPNAIGVSYNKKSDVVTVCGDGGFAYGFNELSTAKKYEIPIKILLFNNKRFDAIVRAHRFRYNNESDHYQLYNPDFKCISDAYDINYYKTDYRGVKDTICKANKESKSYIIEVISDDIPMFNSIKWEDLNLNI